MPPAAEVLEVRCLLSTITVTTLTDGPLSDPDDGAVSLREALEAANTNASVDGSVAGEAATTQDAIVFQAGLTGTISLTAGQLTISETVAITGLGAARTLIDAQLNSRVFDITSAAGNVTLDSLTLTGGRTTGDNANFYDNTNCGGGIRFLPSATLTISNGSVSGNSTTGFEAGGGGIFSRYGTMSVTNSTVSGNSTAGIYADGGGIYSVLGGVTLSNSTVSGNSTTGGEARGGIFSRYGAVTLTNSTVSSNSTAGSGAFGSGIFSFQGAVTLTNSTVSGNSTAGSGASGGGIYDVFGAVTLTNSTVSGNSTAGSGAIGGGISSFFSGVTLTNSTVSGNSTKATMPSAAAFSTAPAR